MLAIAWKEYRQMRLAGALVVGVLVLIDVMVGASPWHAHQANVLPLGLAVIVSFAGALAFAQDKSTRNDAFVRSLPLGRAKWWRVTVGTNLVLTAAAAGVFIVVVWLLDREEWNSISSARGFLATCGLVGGVCLAIWSSAIFFSSALERPVGAMVAAWGTLLASVAAASRLNQSMGNFFGLHVGEADVLLTALGPFLAAVVVTFLVGSLGATCLSRQRLTLAAKAAIVGGVIIAAFGLGFVGLGGGIAYQYRQERAWDYKYDADRIRQVCSLPDGSLLALRVDGLYRRSASGEWRRYGVEGAWMNVEYGRGWKVSADGNVLAFTKKDPKGVLDIAGEMARRVVSGEYAAFYRDRNSLQLLDLRSGRIRAPRELRGRDIRLVGMAWAGDPSRLYVLADRVRLGANPYQLDLYNVKSSELLVLSEQGKIVERRDVPEINAMRDRRRLLDWEVSGGSQLYGPVVEDGVVTVGRYQAMTYQTWPTDGGAALVYDLASGESRRRIVEDPEHHLAFSPSLGWEVNTAEARGGALGGWHVLVDRAPRGGISSRVTFQPRGGLPWYRDAGGARDKVPPILLARGEREIEVCGFSDATEIAEIQFQFTEGERAFLALVTELARSEAEGFEGVGAEHMSVRIRGRVQEDLGFRRVRMVGIDLGEMRKREVALPPEVMVFLLDPAGKRVFCRNYSSTYPYETTMTTCVVLDAPGLGEVARFKWPGRNGPNFGPVGISTAFLEDGRIVSAGPVGKAQLVIWRMDENGFQPEPVELPAIRSEK